MFPSFRYKNSSTDNLPNQLSTSSMSRPLEGKFGIVTGGSRGIGEAIAKNLASKGCSLLLNFTSESSRGPTEALCKTLISTHQIRCISVQADLSAPEEAVKAIMDAAATHFPNTTIDILINNAGVSADRTLNDTEKGPIDTPYFNWHYTINVLAPLLLTQAVAPHLPTDRSGRIVNISSVSSSLGFVGQTVYGGTKAALEAMTRTWARELADRATVNAVNPGPVTGDMYFKTGEGFWNQIQGFQDNTPLSKLAESEKEDPSLAIGLSDEQKRLVREKMGGRRPAFTEEVAGVVGMLCTADGGWCTGSVVCANGGMKFGV
ncbi:Putative 3-oxoacyl-(Acyl-carrier-protein) reductase (AFU_orthologue; AFUA_1G10100) [Aspergillus calidoustus]|uniref:Putative 3-oxoacyl-(Acyl-carrier-protein) reductase (AFU_orthologue AFUA_1G10100) n=1 Tax=Aspergillus calidoustus TaxID=454130 RepID=A0A0U5GUC6_ASPCI|nr:Putative 3-oxoacyl-(Acyl-carrier-protein) reductase (AFU_orthologue; AFUA_1G10100) [Aspergillus calidoustus]